PAKVAAIAATTAAAAVVEVGLARRRLAAPATLAPTAAAEELNIVSDDLGGPALVTVLGLPRPGAQLPLHIDLPALAQILGAQLGSLAPHDDAMPLGALLPLAALVGPGLVGREPELAYTGAAGRVTHVRISAEISY